MRNIPDVQKERPRGIRCRSRSKSVRLLRLADADVLGLRPGSLKCGGCGAAHLRVGIIQGVPQSRGSWGSVSSEGGQVKGCSSPALDVRAPQGADERGNGSRPFDLDVELHCKIGSRWLSPVGHAPLDFRQDRFCLRAENLNAKP